MRCGIAKRDQPGVNAFPLLIRQVRSLLPPPRGDWAMRMRFWDESTREVEKLVRLSSRNFFRCATASPHAFHCKARSHYPITALCSLVAGKREPVQERTKENSGTAVSDRWG